LKYPYIKDFITVIAIIIRKIYLIINTVKPEIGKLLYFSLMESDFKQNLRSELDYLDLTVKELSAKTGIAKGTLDCYLGIRSSMPPADIAVKIARVLGVSVEYLVTGTESRNDSLLSYNQNIRSIVQLLSHLAEKDVEIILALIKTFNKIRK
jgi:transcriptional regulator with XRE-family HTH domain